MEKGCIHVYCGDGKGKTTAALGLAVRAAGNGYRVVLAQFFKTWETGELNILKNVENIEILRGNIAHDFTWDLNAENTPIIAAEQQRIFEEAVQRCTQCAQYAQSEKTLLILDEAIGALNYGLLDKAAVIGFLKSKPAALEVVLTGRKPMLELIELADYISEIKKIKHPNDNGLDARAGIEY